MHLLQFRAKLAGLRAHHGSILEHLGAKVGLRWVFLGASWAVWRHFGALREAPGRHLEAKVGLGSIDLELTRGKKASCQNLEKPLKNQGFSMIFGGGKVKKACQDGSLEVWL